MSKGQTFSTEKREELAEKGEAMPSGAYPIRNRADLQRAIQAFGRASDPLATKRWIIKRARELEAVDFLPDGWVPKELQQTAMRVADILEHHGVKGMKWGVRRSRNERARRETFGGDKTKQARDKASKNRRNLSDKDIDQIISRLEKEKKLRNLVDADIRPGRTAAQKLLSSSGTVVASTVATAVGTYAVRAALEKKFSAGELATYLKPKKR